MSTSIPDLEIDNGQLHILKQKLVQEKQAIQAQLAEINARCSVILPTKQFHKIRSQRGQIVKMLTDKEAEISAVKARLTQVSTVLHVKKHEEFGANEISKLVELRDKTHAFSMDPENHQKARETAWKFSQDLRTILRTYFHK
jgi:hypothetical protein